VRVDDGNHISSMSALYGRVQVVGEDRMQVVIKRNTLTNNCAVFDPNVAVHGCDLRIAGAPAWRLSV